MLEVKNLYSGYDGRDILKDINFKVKNGSVAVWIMKKFTL